MSGLPDHVGRVHLTVTCTHRVDLTSEPQNVAFSLQSERATRQAVANNTIVMLGLRMTSGAHRPKQPEMVRVKILAAGAELLSEGAPLSIGEVATAAGVTKGAVQHHYASRDLLLSAIYDDLQSHFEEALVRYQDERSAAQSYVAATVDSTPDKNAVGQWRALLVACVIERGLADKWNTWTQANRTANGKESTSQLVARLAADGLWLSDILGTYRLGKAERKKLAQALEHLAKEESE